MTSLTPGMRLHDRHVLVERIGSGGMAQVWRADDLILGRPVAVKVLDAGVGGDATRRLATRNEAQAAARLTHPHITRVYDYGEADLPDGRTAPYLVMELLSGRGLDERLGEGPLSVRDATAIAGQVAQALAAAHEIGVVHCDVKPGNVMLTPTGAKVLDFGIAAITGETAGGRPLYGTPGYLAPERLAGAEAAPSADVYALGVLLAEALTGKRPDPPGTFPTVTGLPATVARLGAASLAADPAARPSAAEFADALTAAGAGSTAVGSAPAGSTPATAHGEGAAPIGRAAVVSPTRPLAPDDEAAPAAPPASPHRRRLLVGGAAAGVALIAITAVAMALAGRPDDGGAEFQTGAGGPVVETPAGPTAANPQPGVDKEATKAPVVPDDDDPGAASLAAFQEAVTIAVTDGTISADAEERIDKRLEKLREAVAERDDVAKAVADLRKEIRNAKGIDRPTRTALLKQLDDFDDDH